MDRILQKDLSSLVRGVRQHKSDEREYIQTVQKECLSEIQNRDTKVKAVGVQKVTYLSMIGYDMGDSVAFPIVEVMADTNFLHKRIGYLAAAQCFQRDTAVVMLTVNMFRKDLKSANQYECGMALSCIAAICTTDLARDLVQDLIGLLSSQRSYVRKKVLLVLFKVFMLYPDALKIYFPSLKEKLSDSDPTVISAAVNTVCELARQNPKNYLGMAPQFFKLLNDIHNNWTLIKVVKLFGALTPLEPRLAKKLVEPLTNLINSTAAKSLLYECLNTVATGMVKHSAILKLSLEKLKGFVEDKDQNLKYLGLLGLNSVMQHNPKYIQEMSDTVMDCLADEDITIRYRALDLVVGMVNRKNIMKIVTKLVESVKQHEGQYKRDLITKILETCSANNYERVPNFEWYLRVLMDLVQSEVQNVQHGGMLACQFMDVVVRVKAIRDFGIKCMTTILQSTMIISESTDIERSNMYEVIHTAAWLCGEYAAKLKKPKPVVDSLLQPAIKQLPPTTQATTINVILKIFSFVMTKKPAEGLEMVPVILEGIESYLISPDVEVQERATQLKVVMRLITDCEEGEREGLVDGLAQLFDEELMPVGAETQSKVPDPVGLDLDENLTLDGSDSDDYTDSEESDGMPDVKELGFATTTGSEFYLPSGPAGGEGKGEDEEESPQNPKANRDRSTSSLSNLGLGNYSSSSKKNSKKDKKNKKDRDSVVVASVEVNPEGWVEPKKEDKKARKKREAAEAAAAAEEAAAAGGGSGEGGGDQSAALDLLMSQDDKPRKKKGKKDKKESSRKSDKKKKEKKKGEEKGEEGEEKAKSSSKKKDKGRKKKGDGEKEEKESSSSKKKEKGSSKKKEKKPKEEKKEEEEDLGLGM